MMDAAGMQQQHKGLRPERVVTSRKQENYQQSHETDSRARDHKVNSQVFHYIAENECLDIVKELAPTKKK
jgi:hypothetical protein